MGVLLSTFDPHDEDMLRGYWQALGRFVFYYAYLEDAMQQTLRRVTRTPPAVGKAIFSGVRVSQAISNIRRTYEARGEAVPAFLEETMQKAGAINSERDRILHHGIYFRAWDEGIVTDQARQLDRKVRTTQITVPLLDDLNWDTMVVWSRLVVFNRTLSRKIAASESGRVGKRCAKAMAL
ncbi:hypothetical protein [Sphingomonas sp. LM7]|uniref:hypothetical protein n=1 Tax=Sphingomonas sp. LM7 TaxID=1938607 RepID=UPI000983C1FF|nr:hypothetical protein [Sphingomonas sp. LM7]AQR74937.1 hypothetical protein BXU08_15830 [Sphingomonas sp. LM7]